ncbi:MAG: DUF4260 domain-containing protein [Actinomycetota bacterium]
MTNPVIVQRWEGLVGLTAGVGLFAVSGWSWWWFALLLLVPDVSMIGYWAQPVAGATVYNLGHSLVGPALLLGWRWFGGPVTALALGAIWLAHIGMDRALGYGLKYPNGFTHTHLGIIGRREL